MRVFGGVLAGGHGISLVVDFALRKCNPSAEGPRVAVGGFVGFRQDNKWFRAPENFRDSERVQGFMPLRAP